MMTWQWIAIALIAVILIAAGILERECLDCDKPAGAVYCGIVIGICVVVLVYILSERG